jgi:hypothetical protein
MARIRRLYDEDRGITEKDWHFRSGIAGSTKAGSFCEIALSDKKRTLVHNLSLLLGFITDKRCN